MEISILTTVFVSFAVFLAGFVDSIAGGGGLISLPAYYAVGIPPHMALGTNKFSSTCGTAIATTVYLRNKSFHLPTAIFSVIFAFIGSTIGSKLTLFVDEIYLKYILLILVPIIAVFTLINKNFDKPKVKNFTKMQMTLLASLIGMFLGIYDGFFGPGMGMFLMLAYTTILGFDVLTASGNAKMVNLSSNLAATMTFIMSGNVVYKLAIPAAVCGIIGNYLGSKLAVKKGGKIVKPLVIVVMVLLLLKIGLDLLNK
ncbi:MAG: TSUP family transporter [Oscillospiraceae bacterium]